MHLHPSYQGKINNGGDNRFEITHIVGVLRWKLALQSYFRGRGRGDGAEGEGGERRGGEFYYIVISWSKLDYKNHSLFFSGKRLLGEGEMGLATLWQSQRILQFSSGNCDNKIKMLQVENCSSIEQRRKRCGKQFFIGSDHYFFYYYKRYFLYSSSLDWIVRDSFWNET